MALFRKRSAAECRPRPHGAPECAVARSSATTSRTFSSSQNPNAESQGAPPPRQRTTNGAPAPSTTASIQHSMIQDSLVQTFYKSNDSAICATVTPTYKLNILSHLTQTFQEKTVWYTYNYRIRGLQLPAQAATSLKLYQIKMQIFIW